MKKLLLLSAISLLRLNACVAPGQPQAETSPTWTEWHDQQVNEVNRYKLHTNFFAYENEALAKLGDITSRQTIFRSKDLGNSIGWKTPTNDQPTSTRLTLTTLRGRR